MKKIDPFLGVVLLSLTLSGCFLFESPSSKSSSREVYFIGVDISGSFVKSGYFNDAKAFLAHYLYSHLKGLGGLKDIHSLFVGPLGGKKLNEPKTFFPIESFSNRSLAEIQQEIEHLFPENKQNIYTDFNAFFEQVAEVVKDKNLSLRPITIVMLTDGIPDIRGVKGDAIYRNVNLKPLENLSRNVTLRVLYTSAITSKKWHGLVKRNRVKIWAQDNTVMHEWKDPHTFLPNVALEHQDRFFSWVKDNVDFPGRIQHVN